jgi:hypothetical protein
MATSSIGGVDVRQVNVNLIRKKTYNSRWIIPCTTLCVTIAKDRLHDVEAGGQTTAPGGPTTSRSHATTRSCAPSAAAVVEAIIVVPSLARADLYALLQCGEDSEYWCKAYGGYIEVFWMLVAEDDESSPSASGNF